MPAAMPQRSAITPPMRREIINIVDERIREAHVTKEDFSELKVIIRELAEVQKRTELRFEELAVTQKSTEQRLGGLATAQQELAESEKRTEQRVEELAVAQKRTEQRIEEMVAALKDTQLEIKTLTQGLQENTQRLLENTQRLQENTQGLQDNRNETGGLARSMGYAFENDVYRHLPEILSERYGIRFIEKMIRKDLAGKEINLLGRAEKNGTAVWVVGEAKLRLDERRLTKKQEVFDDLEEKAQAVRQEQGEVEVVKVLVTHFATNAFQKLAKEKGVIVVQSFEW